MLTKQKPYGLKTSKLLLLASTGLGLAMTPVGAKAQSEQSLDNIVVTAQKREESLKDVPVSIQVLTVDFVLKEDVRS